MRITLFGGTGLLGKALNQEWAREELTSLGSKDADLRDEEQVTAAVRQSRPEWTILSAAYADVDGCERDPERAMAVNCQGAIYVAKAAREAGSRLLFVSTDYVFDGMHSTPYEVDDQRNPLSVYGRSKAEAEVALLDILPECCIVRTSWLFGPGGKSFPDAILALAETQPELSVVNDQRGCPSYTPDVAAAMAELCRKQAKGILHAVNCGDGTRYELACEIVRAAGLPAKMLPTTTDHMKRPAQRPKYSVLSTKSLEAYGIALPTWQDGVRRFLQTRRQLRSATV